MGICRTPKYHPVVPMKAMAQIAPVQTTMPIMLEVNVHGTLWPHQVTNRAEDDQEGVGVRGTATTGFTVLAGGLGP